MPHHLTQRRLSHEKMDDQKADRAELVEALRFLRMVNMRLGGAAAALVNLKRWASNWPENQVIRILDIGTGSADIPAAMARWAARSGHQIQITGVDLHPITIDLAREHVRNYQNITLMQADALKLMDDFKPGAFDYVHAGLFLHHLHDVDVMTVLRIMDRLSSRGLIWNDLVRGWFSRIGVRLMTMGPSVPEMVRHDAIVSEQAGFTRREAIDLARRCGIENAAYRRHLLHRFTLTVQK